MKTEKITCDSCKKEIVPHENKNIYFLMLRLGAFAHTGNLKWGNVVEPPIKRNMDFCCIACMKNYFN